MKQEKLKKVLEQIYREGLWIKAYNAEGGVELVCDQMQTSFCFTSEPAAIRWVEELRTEYAELNESSSDLDCRDKLAIKESLARLAEINQISPSQRLPDTYVKSTLYGAYFFLDEHAEPFVLPFGVQGNPQWDKLTPFNGDNEDYEEIFDLLLVIAE